MGVRPPFLATATDKQAGRRAAQSAAGAGEFGCKANSAVYGATAGSANPCELGVAALPEIYGEHVQFVDPPTAPRRARAPRRSVQGPWGRSRGEEKKKMLRPGSSVFFFVLQAKELELQGGTSRAFGSPSERRRVSRLGSVRVTRVW